MRFGGVLNPVFEGARWVSLPLFKWFSLAKRHPCSLVRFKIVDRGSLVITGVRLSDSGYYVCRARNVYGSRKTTPAKLSVLGE